MCSSDLDKDSRLPAGVHGRIDADHVLANLVEIGLLCHSQDGNVSVGSGEIVPINIREIERVSRTRVERNDENEK